MLLIKQATIHAMTGAAPFVGDLLLSQGKIQRIGPELSCPEAQELDARGLHAYPGLVDAHTHIGGMNFSAYESEDDYNEMTASLTSSVSALYGANPASQDFRYAVHSGITTLCLTPGSGNVLNGTAIAVKSYGNNIFDMVVRDAVAMKVALGGNPKRTYAKVNQAPSTRMSIPYLMRDLHQRTLAYSQKKERGEAVEYDAQLEAMLPVLHGQLPLKIHCTQFDILTAIEIAREWNAAFSLEHVWGATHYMDEIVESGCSVCFGPIGSMNSPGECAVIDIESVIELDKRGVTVALITDAPILSVDSLLLHAGEAVRQGLSPESAMRMLTISPARILGVEDRVGTLEAGKDADVVLFSGQPALEMAARPVYTIGAGNIIFQA